jgi:hypothetical protein
MVAEVTEERFFPEKVSLPPETIGRNASTARISGPSYLGVDRGVLTEF